MFIGATGSSGACDTLSQKAHVRIFVFQNKLEIWISKGNLLTEKLEFVTNILKLSERLGYTWSVGCPFVTSGWSHLFLCTMKPASLCTFPQFSIKTQSVLMGLLTLWFPQGPEKPPSALPRRRHIELVVLVLGGGYGVWENPMNVISLILQMFLLTCQICWTSTISEPGDYSQERRNFQTSAPP